MLTEQQIRDMEPGRELDALVSEMIMGYKMKPMSLPIFQPSTQIGSAWEVVEKMHEDERWTLALERYRDSGEWAADFDELGFSAQIVGKNAPEVIVKAALIAHMRGGSGE